MPKTSNPPFAGLLASLLLFAMTLPATTAEDGYRLWLRYDPLTSEAQVRYAAQLGGIDFPATSPTLEAARRELAAGLRGLIGLEASEAPPAAGRALRVGTPQSNPDVAGLADPEALASLGPEGYLLRYLPDRGVTLVMANTDQGVLYGVFAFLRHLQQELPLEGLDVASQPRIAHRLLNHWDNLDGFVERGYAGFSIWDWFDLPYYLKPRYTDYARACASIGINGAALTNVNANATVLTAAYLEKVAALADVFRPYHLRVYLTARFSAPVEIGGLPTADPLDPAVRQWWSDKASEIYALIPDFGGFVVKANSEGQPGPQDYDRSHAEGANMLADALAPHRGVVMWRAFVYDQHVPDDRAKQAYDEFEPLDGEFRDNVYVQIKNGPIDFMPREPFHPLFGAMPETRQTLEVQITQEYLGQGTHLAFLAPMWKETLESDTFARGPGSTVARIIDGSLEPQPPGAICGVANIGDDRNWTGHPLAQANWYAFGRLAWDHRLPAAAIAEEWTRLTFSNDPAIYKPIAQMLLQSRETRVKYSMPLGLHHIMAQGHHYGPGPWVDGIRPDWTSVYYHRADAQGIGFDRTASGSNALAQYAPEVAAKYADPQTCPTEYLLWFHHLPWDFRMPSGHTLWQELCLTYQQGCEEVDQWVETWRRLEPHIDEQRHQHVSALLRRQSLEARWWRDACLLYFQTFSQRPLPPSVGKPAHSLEHYMNIELKHMPGNPGG